MVWDQLVWVSPLKKNQISIESLAIILLLWTLSMVKCLFINNQCYELEEKAMTSFFVLFNAYCNAFDLFVHTFSDLHRRVKGVAVLVKQTTNNRAIAYERYSSLFINRIPSVERFFGRRISSYLTSWSEGLYSTLLPCGSKHLWPT